MNKLDKQYQDLLQSILDYGVEKKDRTGTGTKSIFGYTIRHNMKDGFPLLTTKKMAWKTMLTELLWFLRGDTNIKFLVDNGCHIWDGDAYKNYLKNHKDNLIGCTIVLSNGISAEITAQHNVNRNVLITTKGRINIEGDDTITILNDTLTQEEFINKIKTDDEFAKKWGELGPIYGKQWRSWESTKWGVLPKRNGGTCGHSIKHIDQITNLIDTLKTNPDSRRLIVSAWNVGELDQMVLPPCHYGFQVYTRELSFAERVMYYETTFGRLHFIPPSPDALDARNIPTRAISLMWNQRSVDTFLGLPFNIASYGLLLEIIAKEVNMVPDELIGNLGDTHLYLNHIEQAKEQIGRDLTDEERYNIWFNNNYETGMERYFDPNNLPDFDNEYYAPTPKRTREPFELPKLRISSGPLDDIAHHEIMDFDILNYQSHPAIKAPLSN
jgi:thymidylate synthase